jgi:hypothetical protein
VTEPASIKPREREAILQSLRAGVVPRIGQQHIQVGRANEIGAVIEDIDSLQGGGSSLRFVIGEYGSGKTFFLMLVRAVALEKRLVTVHADLGPERRLQGGSGQARSLYAELLANVSTRAKPDGGALVNIVERFLTDVQEKAREGGQDQRKVVRERLALVRNMVGGYDFASVIEAYWAGSQNGSDQLQSDAVRWLRGEFTTKTEARVALGVRTIIDDENWYDHLKVLARFVRMAGYSGLLICLDELVSLYRLANTSSRVANYERLLHILNDSLQGGAAGMGWLFGGTPEFLMDTRRGLYSYAALQSRLAENTFATAGLVDYSGPVLRLANLSREDMYVLLTKIRHVYSSGHYSESLLPDQGLTAFMQHCQTRVGDAYFRTPRNTVKEFVNLLAVLEQNPEVSWSDVLEHVKVTIETNPDLAPSGPNDGHVTSPAPTPVAAWQTATNSQGNNDELTNFRL